MVDYSLLLEIQFLDLAIDEIDGRVRQQSSKTDRLAGEIQKEEELLKNKEALLKKINLRNRKAETELKSLSEKNQTNELRMKGAGMNPDAYVALEKEVIQNRGKISDLETLILGDMEKVEVLEKDVEKGRKVLAGRKIFLEETKQKGSGQLLGLKKEREDLFTRRNQASLRVPADVLGIYEDLRQRLKGQVIWETEKDSCPACGMSLPRGFVKSLIGSNQADHCPTCTKLLRWTGITDGIHSS